MCWIPGRSDRGRDALLLERRGRGTSEPLLLVLHAAELCLMDTAGQVLASASDLPALLDAVDRGIGDQGRASSWLVPAPPGTGNTITAKAA